MQLLVLPGSDATFLLLTSIVALVASAIAAVLGFGLGSILTPWLALEFGTRIAVAAISAPHLIGSALRFWVLRRHLDRHILVTFGLASAAGGLLGAIAHAFSSNPLLTIVFATILILTGISGVFGLSEHLRLPRQGVWLGGAVSGLLGGMVGSQGPIRAAAMLGFELPKQAFVATATAIALIVDLVRIPVYLFTVGPELAAAWPYIVAATVAVVIGTLGGWRVLERLPAPGFRKIVSAVILLFGLVVLVRLGYRG